MQLIEDKTMLTIKGVTDSGGNAGQEETAKQYSMLSDLIYDSQDAVASVKRGTGRSLIGRWSNAAINDNATVDHQIGS